MSTAIPYDPAPTDKPMTPIPAATVILVRAGHDSTDGVEVLMLKRTGGGTFGGFWVFPGGRVDAEDADDLATAVREAKEESNLDLDPASFVRFSHWIPPAFEIKRFSTAFFIAPAPVAHDNIALQETEIVDHAWVRAGEMLERRERGEIELAPPTFVSLWEISHHATVESVIDHARRSEPPLFETRLLRFDDENGKRSFTVWAGDVAHDDPSRIDDVGGRHRIEISASPWVYVRDV